MKKITYKGLHILLIVLLVLTQSYGVWDRDSKKGPVHLNRLNLPAELEALNTEAPLRIADAMLIESNNEPNSELPSSRFRSMLEKRNKGSIGVSEKIRSMWNLYMMFMGAKSLYSFIDTLGFIQRAYLTKDPIHYLLPSLLMMAAAAANIYIHRPNLISSVANNRLLTFAQSYLRTETEESSTEEETIGHLFSQSEIAMFNTVHLLNVVTNRLSKEDKETALWIATQLASLVSSGQVQLDTNDQILGNLTLLPLFPRKSFTSIYEAAQMLFLNALKENGSASNFKTISSAFLTSLEEHLLLTKRMEKAARNLLKDERPHVRNQGVILLGATLSIVRQELTILRRTRMEKATKDLLKSMREYEKLAERLKKLLVNQGARENDQGYLDAASIKQNIALWIQEPSLEEKQFLEDDSIRARFREWRQEMLDASEWIYPEEHPIRRSIDEANADRVLNDSTVSAEIDELRSRVHLEAL